MPVAAFNIRFVMHVDGSSIGKVRNFGEELMSTMREHNLGHVSDTDTALDELVVTMNSPRYLGTLRKLIRKLLLKHHLDADAVITEVTGSSSETTRPR